VTGSTPSLPCLRYTLIGVPLSHDMPGWTCGHAWRVYLSCDRRDCSGLAQTGRVEPPEKQ
jgi:hypothetical protein